MRVRAYKLKDGKVRLEIGYYRQIFLKDMEELVQLSADLNNQISLLFNPANRTDECHTIKRPSMMKEKNL